MPTRNCAIPWRPSRLPRRNSCAARSSRPSAPSSPASPMSSTRPRQQPHRRHHPGRSLREFNREFESGACAAPRSAISWPSTIRPADPDQQPAQGQRTDHPFQAGRRGPDQRQRRPFDLAEVVGNVVLTCSPSSRPPRTVSNWKSPGYLPGQFPWSAGAGPHQPGQQCLLHGFHDIAAGACASPPSAWTIRSVSGSATTAAASPPNTCHASSTPSSTTRLGQGGSGLGLHIVYSIVTASSAGASC